MTAFVVAILVVCSLVLLNRERHYEHDPALRARAGLVDATSDISLTRAANFGRAMAAIGRREPSGAVISILSVLPTEVHATIVTAAGNELDVAVTPGIHVETHRLTHRVNNHSGIRAGDLPADGPARIIQRAEQRFGLRPGEFERLELDAPVGDQPAYWSATWSEPTDDPGVLADLDGTHVRRSR